MFHCLCNNFCEAGVILERNNIQRIQCVHHSVINQLLVKIPLFTMGRARINVSKSEVENKIPKLKNAPHKIPIYQLKNLNGSLSSEVNKEKWSVFS